MEIYLVRHTAVQTEKNICYGQLDVPLNLSEFENGFDIIKNKLPHNYNYIFSSPLSRCTTLAEKLNKEKLQLDDDLLEMNFGQWEGNLWDSINQSNLTQWMQDFVNISPPNGENLLTLYSRVENFVTKLRSNSALSKEKIVIVTHAGVIRCFYAYFLGLPLENIFKLCVQFNEVHHFKLTSNSQTDLVVGKF